MNVEDYEKQGYQTVVFLDNKLNDRKLDYVIHALMQHNATHCGNYDDLRVVFNAFNELTIIGKTKDKSRIAASERSQ